MWPRTRANYIVMEHVHLSLLVISPRASIVRSLVHAMSHKFLASIFAL